MNRCFLRVGVACWAMGILAWLFLAHAADSVGAPDADPGLRNGWFEQWTGSLPDAWDGKNVSAIAGFDGTGKVVRFGSGGEIQQRVALRAGESYRLSLTYRTYGSGGVAWKLIGVKADKSSFHYGTPYWHTQPLPVVETIRVESVAVGGAWLQLSGPEDSEVGEVELAPAASGFTGAAMAALGADHAEARFGIRNPHAQSQRYAYRAELVNYFDEPIAEFSGSVTLGPGQAWFRAVPFATGDSEHYRAELHYAEAPATAERESVAFLEGDWHNAYRRAWRITQATYQLHPRQSPAFEPGSPSTPITFPGSVSVKGTPYIGGIGGMGPNFDPDTDYWVALQAQLPAEACASRPAEDRLLVDIPQAQMSPEVYVGGQLAGKVEGDAPLVADVTPFLKAGDDTLEIRLVTWKGAQRRTGQGLDLVQVPLLPTMGNASTIPAPIWVREEPAIRVEDVFIQTSFRHHALTLTYTVKNDTTRSQIVRVSPQIFYRGRPALTLPPVNVFAYGGGAESKVTVTQAWPNPHLWMPRDPQLYRLTTLLAVDGKTVDQDDTRFGFREVWDEGKAVYWNGQHLKLATRLGMPYTRQSGLEDTLDNEWRAVRQYSDRGIWMGRFNPHFLDIREGDLLDEMGFLARIDLYLNNAYTDWRDQPSDAPEYWQMMDNEVDRLVRQGRNRPSILAWSMENETFLCGVGVHFPWLVDRYARMQAIAKAALPGILMQYDGGGEGPNGGADWVNFHYPLNPASTIPVQDSYPPHIFEKDTVNYLHLYPGAYAWNEMKPMVLGEDFLGFPETPGSLSILNDESIYDVRDDNPQMGRDVEAFERAYARLQQPLMRAYRQRELTYITTWPLTDPSLLDTLQAVAVFIDQPYRHFYAGEKATLTGTLHYDLLEPAQGTLRWKLTGKGGEWANGSETVPLESGSIHSFAMPLQMPALSGRGTAELHIELQIGDKIAASRSAKLDVFPRRKAAANAQRLAVWDPEGDTVRSLRDQGYSVDETTLPKTGEPFVIGRNALVNHAAGFPAEKILAFAREGGSVLVMEQRGRVPEWLPVRLRPNVGCYSFAAFPRAPGNPVLKGLDADDLSFWRGPGSRVASFPYWKPRGSALLSIIDTGTVGGYLTTALAELPVGRGKIFLSQFELADNVGREPVADALLANLVTAAAIPSDEKGPASLAVVGSDLDAAACAAGLKPCDEAAADHAQILLVDATAGAAQAAAWLQRAGEGRTLWLSDLTPATAPVWVKAGLPALTLDNQPRYNVIKEATSPLLAGLSNTDLYWLGMALAPLPGEYAVAKKQPICVSDVLAPVGSGYQELLSHGALLTRAWGKGLLILDQTTWPHMATHGGQRDIRVPVTLARNLGAEVEPVGQDCSFPAPDALTFTSIDLSPVYNESLNSVLTGKNSFLDIPFDIRANAPGAVLLGSKLLTQPEPRLTSRTAPVPVGKRFDAVYFLLVAYDPYESGLGYGSGDAFGGVDVAYADGSSATFSLLDKVHAANLFESFGDLAGADVAWTGPTPFAAWWDLDTRWPGNRWVQSEEPNHLYAVRWLNPHPDRKIASLSFYSTDLHVVPAFLAATGAVRKQN